jgi:hypothetical protein
MDRGKESNDIAKSEMYLVGRIWLIEAFFEVLDPVVVFTDRAEAKHFAEAATEFVKRAKKASWGVRHSGKYNDLTYGEQSELLEEEFGESPLDPGWSVDEIEDTVKYIMLPLPLRKGTRKGG